MTPKKILRLAGLVFGAAVLIALAYIYHLNGFINLPSETPQVSETSTTQPTFTPKASETATLTPISPTETATATEAPTQIPAIVDGINLLTYYSFIPREGGKSVWIKTYEIANGPDSRAITEGQTYGYLNTDVEHHKDWVVSTMSIFYPGAGKNATERAKNESPDEFSTCVAENFRSCQLTKAQLLDGSYGRWAQKMFGDENHLIKIIVYPGATSYEKMGFLQSSLKAAVTDQLLGIALNSYLGGSSQYYDEIVADSLQKNPAMFDNFKKFQDNGNPEPVDGDSIIYEAILAVH